MAGNGSGVHERPPSVVEAISAMKVCPLGLHEKPLLTFWFAFVAAADSICAMRCTAALGMLVEVVVVLDASIGGCPCASEAH